MLRRGSQPTFSPREIIGVLSRLIARLGPLTQTIGGTLRFRIAGAEGGSWCVRMDEPGGVWSSGDHDADTIVYATAPAFRALLQAAPTVVEHMKRGELIVTGDREKLERLGRLITSGGGAIAMRARNNTQRKTREVRG